MSIVRKGLILTTLIISLVISGVFVSSSFAQEKPGRVDVILLKTTATVVSIDRKSKLVTLKDEVGELVSYALDDKAGQLADVDAGDTVTLEYMESVSIQVYAAGTLEEGMSAEVAVAATEPGQKPAKMAGEQVTVVVKIVAIDLEQGLTTLEGVDGVRHTVRPEKPENLKKVKIGDQVEIIYTRAVAVSVTENTEIKK